MLIHLRAEMVISNSIFLVEGHKENYKVTSVGRMSNCDCNEWEDLCQTTFKTSNRITNPPVTDNISSNSTDITAPVAPKKVAK